MGYLVYTGKGYSRKQETEEIEGRSSLVQVPRKVEGLALEGRGRPVP